MLAMAARDEAVEGDWLVADRQTAGRGRSAREWHSPDGNFYGSTIVTLRDSDPPAPTLALAVGLGLVEAIGEPAYLKWPNDLMIATAKVAGVLLERHGDVVVAGIGVNLVSAPELPHRRTTYLARHGTGVQARDEVLTVLAQRILDVVALWRAEGIGVIASNWERWAHPRGTMLTVNRETLDSVTGSFDGLTAEGALRLCLADGSTRVIHAGDVFLI